VNAEQGGGPLPLLTSFASTKESVAEALRFLSVRPSIHRLSVQALFVDTVSACWEISLKLSTNIHHVSGHYCKSSRGQRSCVWICVNAIIVEAYILDGCGIEVHLFTDRLKANTKFPHFVMTPCATQTYSPTILLCYVGVCCAVWARWCNLHVIWFTAHILYLLQALQTAANNGMLQCYNHYGHFLSFGWQRPISVAHPDHA